ncbi:MAG: hypothetical protein JO257_03140 [Deltaproteobacteria bacterium]|nr:hypothetical protein [Deltaproteobacteria bacterium]
MNLRCVLVCLLAACTKHDQPAPPPAPAVAPKPIVVQTVPQPAPQPVAQPVPRDVVPCPKDVAEQAAALFGATAKDLDEPKCLAFWSQNTTEWLFWGRLMKADDTVIVAGTRTASTAKLQWRAADGLDGPPSDYQAVDLDGDGNDEVIEHSRASSGEGQLWETLNLYTAAQGELTKRASVPLSYSSLGPSAELGLKRGPEACRGELTFEPAGAGKLLHVKALARKGKPNDSDCPKTATYAFDGKALVEKVASR